MRKCFFKRVQYRHPNNDIRIPPERWHHAGRVHRVRARPGPRLGLGGEDRPGLAGSGTQARGGRLLILFELYLKKKMFTAPSIKEK